MSVCICLVNEMLNFTLFCSVFTVQNLDRHFRSSHISCEMVVKIRTVVCSEKVN